MTLLKTIPVIIILACLGCDIKEPSPSTGITFEGSQKVTITGYADHLMEPSLSRAGNILMFNNSNDPLVNTNLRWAIRVNDSTFEYKGEITGVNTESLEGVPSMDNNGILYFVSTRDYDATLASIYKSNFLDGVVSNVTQVAGISKNQIGWLNFDVEIDSAGETLYFVDGRFDQFGGPYEANIVIAKKVNGEFERLASSDEILKNINTDALEYAACISASNLELYFTRLKVPISPSSEPEIFVATRSSPEAAFQAPSKIESIKGFVEAATISPDGNTLYYHKKDTNGTCALYFTSRIR